MNTEGLKQRGMMDFFGWQPVIGIAAAAVLLGGCSSVPDAVNPVKWYENTVEALTGDDEDEKVAKPAQPIPGGDKDFPKLASVPPKPAVASRQERQQVAEGLVADTERRRYAPSIARQGEAKNVLSGTTPQVADVPTKPASPQAVPTLPATPAPIAPPMPVAAAPAPEMKPAPMPASPTQMAATPPPAPGLTLQPPAVPKVAGTKPMEIAPRPTQPFSPANALMPRDTRSFETVVVSSSGIESGAPVSATEPRAKSRSLQFASASAQAPAATAPAGGSLRVATIQFANGSAGLDARDRSILRHVLTVQRERGGVIEVVGHASSRTANMDPVRHKMVNFQVSENRASNVARTLIKLGARSDAIVVTAKSDIDPMYYEIMPSGEAGNRRVEVFLTF
ncbi:MAG: OmpA family protein [Rhodospirillales bacterium]|nr:OmpA family protein [Rhodospirillales bacterium]